MTVCDVLHFGSHLLWNVYCMTDCGSHLLWRIYCMTVCDVLYFALRRNLIEKKIIK
jgi:hypothetical protein